MGPGNDSGRDERMVQISSIVTGYYKAALEQFPPDEKFLAVAEALLRASRVFIAGNGGSAATAIHFASDLRAVEVRAISLCENISVLTRVGNDDGYEKVFMEQLVEFKPTASDVVFLISVSGKSANVLIAANFAKGIGTPVIGLIGSGGGLLKQYCEIDITLDERDFGIVEGLHSCFCHIIPQLILYLLE